MPEPESGPYGETGWTTEPIMAALTGVATAELRERLAAAEALLRQVRAKGNTREPIPLRLWDDIDAFLDAGGDPDA